MKKSTILILIPAYIILHIFVILLLVSQLGGIRTSLVTFDAAKDGTLALYKRNQLIVVNPDGSEKQYACTESSPGRISIKGSTIKIETSYSYVVFDMEEESFGEKVLEETDAPITASRKPVIAGDKEYSYKSRFFRYRIIEKRADGTESVRYTMPKSEYAVKLVLIVSGLLLHVSVAFLVRDIIKNYRFTIEGKLIPRNTEKQ